MAQQGQLLVGRTRESQSLDALVDGTCKGASRAVFIAGEPGIGKTHLLADLVRHAERRGSLVLEGRAAEFEQELPFALIVDAMDAYLASLDPQAVSRLSSDGLQELGEVFPCLRSMRAASGSPNILSERFLSYHAVRELLERLGARQPLVLVLDDLHWADGATLELVAHLLRRRPEAPFLLAGSFRSGQADPALMVAIEAASDAGRADLLELGPLSADECGRLLGDAARGKRERLFAMSGGNPFYMLQLARMGTRVGLEAAGEADQAPPAVIAAIAHEVGRLSSPARTFAQAASVAGDPFELELAAETAGVAEGAALIALDELVARDLVRPAQVPRRFQFRHPLVRSAVYQSSSI